MARQARDRNSITRQTANRQATRGFETLEPRAMFSASSVLAPTLLSAPQVTAPSFTAAPLAAHQVNLAWNHVSGVTGYVVDEWTGGAWKQIANLGSGSTGYAVTGLAASTTYDFDVEAYNSASAAWANFQAVKTGAVDTTFSPLATDNNGHLLAYNDVSGSLFGANGPKYTDVHQGQVGDCWLLASLAEVAVRDPQDIRNMFTYEGVAYTGNTAVNLYSVRFFNTAGVAEYVTMDQSLPQGGSYYASATNGVLWVGLAEKAYAEANSLGYVKTYAGPSSYYSALDKGQPSWALQAITGKPASSFSINPTNVAADWNKGDLIVLSSSANAGDSLIVGDSQGTHAYALVTYTASSSYPFELYNPWGKSSVIGGTVTYHGLQVFGGAFLCPASLISHDFAAQNVGAGAAPDTAGLRPSTQQFGSVLNISAAAQDVPAAAVRDLPAPQPPLFATPAGLSAQRYAALDSVLAAWGDEANTPLSPGGFTGFHIHGQSA